MTDVGHGALAAAERLFGDARPTQLANGLTVCLLPRHASPLVTTALFYRVGCRDETPFEGGAAHFLEHMMFKGSARYGAGEIDRRTQELGGANNAFTSHDATAYYFDFAPDRWTEALAIESDRMRSLTLAPDELASERRVIQEEIAMYESEPWDALEMAVMAELYGDHPYGKPVLGTRSGLESIGVGELGAFHSKHYGPDNAVLVVAGDVASDAIDSVAEAFADLAPRGRRTSTLPAAPSVPRGGRIVERRAGEVTRVLVAFPAPRAAHVDYPGLRLALAVLAGGRASRLNRRLVDEGQLCSWVTATASESTGPACVSVACELLPGIEPERALDVLFDELARLSSDPPDAAETSRARRIALADWIFGHQRVHHQALSVGAALALFDLEHPRRLLGRFAATTEADLPAVVDRWIPSRDGTVVGFSRPTDGER